MTCTRRSHRSERRKERCRATGPEGDHATVSLLNDISAVVGTRNAIGGPGQQPTLGTGQEPGGPNAARRVTDRFGTVFSSTFSDTMATVYERGASGEFDDRTLALEEQAALQRLRIAQQAAAARPGDGGDAPGSTEGGGATGGPDADPVTTAHPAAEVAVQEQRSLHAVRVRQSEARLSNISVSLQRDFPLAAQLVSASTGSWDPATFVPQTREQAAAFAQRLVIDATEAAARLEIVKTQLDAARFELSQGGGEQLHALVAELEAAYGRQKQYVDKLATIVDQQTGGQMTEAGDDALAGRTMRDAGDLPVAELAASLRASGMSEEQVRRVVGAGEVGVEQERTPGGSVRLKEMASELTRTLVNQFNRRLQEHRDEFRRQEEDRSEQRRLDERRQERTRSERRAVDDKGTEQRTQQALAEQAAAQRAAQQDAEFQQWVQSIAARSGASRRQA